MKAIAFYECVVRHQRRDPMRYGFGHRTYFWFVDTQRLPRRIKARDHAGEAARSIHDNVLGFLRGEGIDLGGGRITMLTQARTWGHVFNPITVYWCHDTDGDLACVVAEVHNTYGGRHRYLLTPHGDGSSSTPKEFYVSPFYDISGEYRMRLPEPDERLNLVIILRREDEKPFTATLAGLRRPATTGTLIRLSLRYPLSALVNLARIRRHGIRLYFKGLKVVPRKAGTA